MLGEFSLPNQPPSKLKLHRSTSKQHRTRVSTEPTCLPPRCRTNSNRRTKLFTGPEPPNHSSLHTPPDQLLFHALPDQPPIHLPPDQVLPDQDYNPTITGPSATGPKRARPDHISPGPPATIHIQDPYPQPHSINRGAGVQQWGRSLRAQARKELSNNFLLLVLKLCTCNQKKRREITYKVDVGTFWLNHYKSACLFTV